MKSPAAPPVLPHCLVMPLYHSSHAPLPPTFSRLGKEEKGGTGEHAMEQHDRRANAALDLNLMLQTGWLDRGTEGGNWVGGQFKTHKRGTGGV